LDALAAALADPAAAAAVCDEVRQAGLIAPMLTALLSGDAAARAILLAAAAGGGDVAAEALALPTLPAPMRQDLLAVRTTA
jgi:hypothetical protein